MDADTLDVFPGLVGVGYTEDDLFYWGWWDGEKRFHVIDSDGRSTRWLLPAQLKGFDRAYA